METTVAASTPDDVYDAVVANVPFGGKLARGENYRGDHKYQDETLEGYFILRALEKLKPGGLAHIIVPDLQELMLVCVQQGIDLDGLLYESPMGPITPLDVLYGHGGMMAQSGQDFYAHRTGFSRRTLANVVEASGFSPMFCQQGNLELNLITFNGDPDPELAALFDLPLNSPDPAAAF